MAAYRVRHIPRSGSSSSLHVALLLKIKGLIVCGCTSPRPCTIRTRPYLNKAIYYPYPTISHQGHVLSVPNPISLRPCTIRTQLYLTKSMYYPYPTISHQGHVLFVPDLISPWSCTICTRP